LTGNSASESGTFSGGGGTRLSIVNNCIVYFNTAPSNPNYRGVQINFTCTTPLPGGGTGNITNNPMFVATNDFRLAAGSPCRDTGSNANAPAGLDLDGNPRFVNGYVDMGAYEYQGSPQGDYDGDGIGNGDEGVAGTGFANSNDVFEVSGVSVMNPASISFDSVTGRVYAVDRNDALIPEPQVWTEFTNNIPGTGSPIMIDDPDDVTNRNYRVRVMLMP
jgi:hypothetical protein